MSLSEIGANQSFHPSLPFQNRTSVWTYGTGKGELIGHLPPPLFKGRYGETDPDPDLQQPTRMM